MVVMNNERTWCRRQETAVSYLYEVDVCGGWMYACGGTQIPEVLECKNAWLQAVDGMAEEEETIENRPNSQKRVPFGGDAALRE